MRKMLPIALAVLVVAPGLAGEAAARHGDDGVNLRFTLSVAGAGMEQDEQTIHILTLHGQHARVQTGWRLPIATTTLDATVAGSPAPVTSYQYQDVGVSLALEGRVVAPGSIRAAGRIEVSAVDSGATASGVAPRLGTFSHSFDALLRDGEPAVLAEVPRPGGGSTTLTAAAEIAD